MNPARREGNDPYLALPVAMVGVAMVSLDVSAVNVAAPSLQRTLGVGLTDIQWVLNVTPLPMPAHCWQPVRLSIGKARA